MHVTIEKNLDNCNIVLSAKNIPEKKIPEYQFYIYNVMPARPGTWFLRP